MEAHPITHPLVSVCMPVYNAGHYLEPAIHSVIAQRYPAIELIIVDDGSTDGSLGIAQKFASEKMRVFSQSTRGASSARNRCLAEATGEFIQFLDADDLLSPDKIAEQIAVLIQNPGKIAVCSTVHFPESGDPLNFQPSTYEESFLIDAEPVHFLVNLYGGFSDKGSMIQPNAWLTPRKIIEKAGPWNETLTLDDDGEYFCRVILCSAGIIKSNGYNYYRKHNEKNNLSALKEQRHLESQYKAMSLKIKHLQAYNSSENLKMIHARWLHDLKFAAYPRFGALTKKMDKELSELGSVYSPRYDFGTRLGNVTAGMIGWRAARWLQIIKNRFH